MDREEKERLLGANPYLQALIRPDDALGDLFATWVLAAAEENRL